MGDTAGFVVIGEDQDPEDMDELASLTAGSLFSFDQDLFDESEEGSWKQEGNIGEAHGSVVVTRRGLAACAITFVFSEGTLVVQGLLPADGKRLGNGTLAVTGATGKGPGPFSHVDVESRNPKRWSFVL